MSADERREDDDEADRLLRFDQDGEHREGDSGFAASLDEQDDRPDEEESSHRVDLSPERGVVPRRGDEEEESGRDQARALAEPASRGPIEDQRDAEVGEDRRYLQQQRKGRPRRVAEQPEDVDVPGWVVGAAGRRVERAGSDARERRCPAGEELHVTRKTLSWVEDEREKDSEQEPAGEDRRNARVARERGHFAVARS